MIPLPNTISNPGAMMIHSDDAFSTNRAMMHSFFLHNIAFKAKTDLVQGFDLIHIYLSFLFVFSSLFFQICLSSSIILNVFQLFIVGKVLWLSIWGTTRYVGVPGGKHVDLQQLIHSRVTTTTNIGITNKNIRKFFIG